jgi:hypothetical protein
MYLHDRHPKTCFYGLLFYLASTLAQENLPQTIFSLDAFSSQKPCAKSCFTTGQLGYCFVDMVGSALGCVDDSACGLGTSGLATNNCYCRTDLQSIAESFLTSCVKSACTAGDSLIDISSAGSIYDSYCSSEGFPVNVPAATTKESLQATTTMYVTVYRSGVPFSYNMAPSKAAKLCAVLFFILVYISDVPCSLLPRFDYFSNFQATKAN